MGAKRAKNQFYITGWMAASVKEEGSVCSTFFFVPLDVCRSGSAADIGSHTLLPVSLSPLFGKQPSSSCFKASSPRRRRRLELISTLHSVSSVVGSDAVPVQKHPCLRCGAL